MIVCESPMIYVIPAYKIDSNCICTYVLIEIYINIFLKYYYNKIQYPPQIQPLQW